jgi:hypothetical protein
MTRARRRARRVMRISRDERLQVWECRSRVNMPLFGKAQTTAYT